MHLDFYDRGYIVQYIILLFFVVFRRLPAGVSQRLVPQSLRAAYQAVGGAWCRMFRQRRHPDDSAAVLSFIAIEKGADVD